MESQESPLAPLNSHYIPSHCSIPKDLIQSLWGAVKMKGILLQQVTLHRPQSCNPTQCTGATTDLNFALHSLYILCTSSQILPSSCQIRRTQIWPSGPTPHAYRREERVCSSVRHGLLCSPGSFTVHHTTEGRIHIFNIMENFLQPAMSVHTKWGRTPTEPFLV